MIDPTVKKEKRGKVGECGMLKNGHFPGLWGLEPKKLSLHVFQKRIYPAFHTRSSINVQGLSKLYDHVCVLDSNNGENSLKHTEHDRIIALGCEREIVVNDEKGSLNALQDFCNAGRDWLFGYLSYDLKNDIDELYSVHPDHLKFPALQFFVPRFVICQMPDKTEIHFRTSVPETELDELIKLCFSEDPPAPQRSKSPEIKARIRRDHYLSSVAKLKEHIRKGDVYEVNFCQEFFSEKAEIDPSSVFKRLNAISSAPFSVFGKFRDHYLVSASPERFLKKKGNQLISQPIKGTERRSGNPQEDERLKNELRENKKERSENIMIVDLVRNDLSRIAQKGSVRVDELCGIYSFRQVHQMISTISCTLKENISFSDILKALFPMGSMTGAPKISAMRLIEKYESTKRGLYSGAVGYITPDGDFDLNVVIRSILYNSTTCYLSFMTGSAITDQSTPEKEYEECLLKAKAMFEVLAAKHE